MVADRVFHVAAVAELAHRQDAPAGLASTCTEPNAGRFDLPEDAVSPGWFSLLGTAGHRGGHLLPGRGAAGSTPNCLPLALQHVGAGDAAHRGAQLCAAAGTDLHWHQHKSCVPSLMSPAHACPGMASPTPHPSAMPPAPSPAVLPAVILVGAHIELEGGWEVEGSLLEAGQDRPSAFGNVQLRGREQAGSTPGPPARPTRGSNNPAQTL